MTDNERRESARKFSVRWKNKGQEDQDTQSFWLDLLQNVYEVEDVYNYIDFEKRVYGEDGNMKRIDGYISATNVLIEQKSRGIALDKPQQNHHGDTPYQQAWRYNSCLPHTENARYIITSNFEEIWIYDMERPRPELDVQKIDLMDLQTQYARLDFLVKKEATKITREMEVSIQAGDLVGLLYDELYKQYAEPNDDTMRSLNKLCVRLVFCMYAEDAGLFGKKDMFYHYLKDVEPKKIRGALKDLFRILNTPEADRDPDEEADLLAFPYVNGGLFEDDNISIPQFTDELKHLLLEKASNEFDWSEISPTIFGAIFESTLNPETRRSGGMHYTSIENIHKVIDPLFLDDLKAEFEDIKAKKNVGGAKTKALQRFQDKLAGLRFLDPASGSGNFLTESYTSLRRMENAVLREMKQDYSDGQMTFGFINGEELLDIKVSIQQFYGIEINDFAVTVAKTALWIAEAQMMKETLSFTDISESFLPLKTYVNITEANALKIDWNDVLPADKCSYVMGNPPFYGSHLQSKEQKEDILSVYLDENGKPYKNVGKIDYVAGWYYKASQYMKGTKIKTALVSTNSITQGEQVAVIWKPLFDKFGIHIDFAYRTFQWDSEANIKAHVHCVIIGFSETETDKKPSLFQKEDVQAVENINPYLLDAPNVLIDTRNKPLCDIPEVLKGSSPVDGGNLLLSNEEYEEIIRKEPESAKYIRRFLGAKEYLHNTKRWCLWLEDMNPSEFSRLHLIQKRVEAVREFRLASKKEATRKYANYPTRFMEIRQPKSEYILIPRHSSEQRSYIPFGFMSPDVICGDANCMIPDASLYQFGILTSNVHMAWVRVVCGRLEMRFRYSNDVVYNNFPWPEITEENKKKIETTAKAILDARALYPDASLADLYAKNAMPRELSDAHTQNDLAVMLAYGMIVKKENGKYRLMSETEVVEQLMKMYQNLTDTR